MRSVILVCCLVLVVVFNVTVAASAGRPAATASSSPAVLAAPNSPTITRGPYLQMGTPSSIMVRWRTDAPTTSRVEYGQTPGSPDQSVEEVHLTTEHEVALSGLAPATVYYYSVGSVEQRLAGGDADFSFRTAPPAGADQPMRVWVLGDSGTGAGNALRVRDAYYAYTGSARTDLWLMLGDNAYNSGTEAEHQKAIFDTFPTMLRSSVLWPTLGNHDAVSSSSATQTGPYYDSFTLPTAGEAGGAASGTEAYYAFDFGNVHFISLNSEDTLSYAPQAMLDWLQDDLTANDQTWTIAFWHRPPYSKGGHSSDSDSGMIWMRTNVAPLLESHGVDLVLGGHSHAYERSYLIDGHYGPSTTFVSSMLLDSGDGRIDGDGAYVKAFGPRGGAVYVVAGSSALLSSGPFDHPAMATSALRYGSLVLDIAGARLDVRFLDRDSVVQDHFTLIKDAVSPTPEGSPTPTPTPSETPEPTPTATATPSPTSTATPTATPSPSATATPTTTPSPTSTATATPTATLSPTATASASPTPTMTPTNTPAATATPQAEPSRAMLYLPLVIR